MILSRHRLGPHLLNRAVLGAACAIVIAGCGRETGAPTIAGKVTYNGNPVTSGVINFLPASGQPLGGGINPDGTYSFELPPGDYQVRIDTPPQLPAGFKEGDPLPKTVPRLVPEKFASFNTSKLSASVTGEQDPQTIDFALP